MHRYHPARQTRSGNPRAIIGKSSLSNSVRSRRFRPAIKVPRLFLPASVRKIMRCSWGICSQTCGHTANAKSTKSWGGKQRAKAIPSLGGNFKINFPYLRTGDYLRFPFHHSRYHTRASKRPTNSSIFLGARGSRFARFIVYKFTSTVFCETAINSRSKCARGK